MKPARRLVVSLHDAAPPFEDEIRAQIEALRSVGVGNLILKVVPNWRGAYPLCDSPTLVQLLQEEHTRGSQIVLHGLEHRSRGPLLGATLPRLRAAIFAPRTAEFMTLPREVARVSLEDGIELLRRIGLPKPDAFCAPGWLITPDAREAVKEAGIRHLVGMFTVQDLETNERLWMRSFGFMGAGLGQEVGVSLLNRISLLAGPTMSSSTGELLGSRRGRTRVTEGWRSGQALKAYLHPDLTGRRRWMKIVGQVGKMVDEGWRVVTLDEVVGGLDRACSRIPDYPAQAHAGGQTPGGPGL